jgi:hypothetical protein
LTSPTPRRSKTTYTETLQNEVCVYEWTRHEVHALNATAASVWQLCDGKTSIEEMAARLSADALPHAAELVALSLEEFQQKHLLDAGDGSSSPRRPISRRVLLRRGLTAALLPVVTSIVAPTPLQAQSPGSRSRTFAYTGASDTFVVPSSVTAVSVSAFGAQGRGNAPGGLGGSVTAILPVVPGETLIIVVGGAPVFSGGLGPYLRGFNGGGRGGGSLTRFADPGGGASDIRRGGSALGDRVVVAGGGGGTGTGSTATGGGGGGPVGMPGSPTSPQAGGGGGTQTAGGAGGTGVVGFPITDGTDGSLGVGGDGGVFPATVVLTTAGGGGGGGYYGGGGGSSGGGGGGGSSFVHPSATGVVHVQGTRAGDGLVILTW